MSAQKQNKFEGLCRLCTSVESNNLHIFGDEGEGRQLASKIRICLPIFVHREDTLPKVVCLPCVTKLESFYSFREACVKAEGTLEAFLKEEQNFPHEPEICLEEGTCPKSVDSVNCEGREEERRGKGKVRGRRKKARCEESVAEDGAKSCRRGKRQKNLEKDESCVQVAEVNGNNITDEPKENPQGGGSESIGQLPIPLSPATDLSHVLFPQLGELHPEDYLLIKEEKFLAGANWNIENLFPPSHEGGLSFIKEEVNSDIIGKDGECLDLGRDTIGGIKTELDSANIIMGQSRQFLPPVWDVFEKVLRESQMEGDETAIVTHRRYIVGKRAFPCALCGNCFLLSGAGNLVENGRSGRVSRGSVGSKQPRDEATERPYGCLRCGKRYFRRSDLVRHEKTHLDARPFVCRLCGKGFCRKEHAQRHMSLHVGEKPFRCEVCLKLFTRKEHLARHKRCHHPEGVLSAEDGMLGAEGTCFEVEKREEEEGNRVETKEEMETNNTNVMSENSTRLRLRNTGIKGVDQRGHREQVAGELAKGVIKKPYQCEICVRAFSRREHLVRHRRSHFREQMKAASLSTSTARQPVQEDDVMESSALADTVIDGLEDSGKSGHSCRFCTQTFSCKEQLDRHRSRMHPLAEAVSAMAPPLPSEEMQPEDSNDALPSAVPSPSPPHLVSEHLAVELLDEVPTMKQSYCCILCPQTFSRKENLERHLKSVHAGLKPYACTCCGKRFGRAEQCRRHENRHQRHQAKSAVATEDDNSTAMASLDVMPDSGEGGNHMSQLSELEGSPMEPVKENDSALGVVGYERLGNGSGNMGLEDQGEEGVLCKDVGSEKVKYPKLKGATKVELPKQQSHRSKRNKSYPCQVCGSIFPKKKYLAKHRSIHVSGGSICK